MAQLPVHTVFRAQQTWTIESSAVVPLLFLDANSCNMPVADKIWNRCRTAPIILSNFLGGYTSVSSWWCSAVKLTSCKVSASSTFSLSSLLRLAAWNLPSPCSSSLFLRGVVKEKMLGTYAGDNGSSLLRPTHKNDHIACCHCIAHLPNMPATKNTYLPQNVGYRSLWKR